MVLAGARRQERRTHCLHWFGASRAADERDASNDIPLFLHHETRDRVSRSATRR